jgi:H+/Cl- antiporter ClcA
MKVSFAVWRQWVIAVALTIGLMFKYALLWTGKLFVWKPLILFPFVLTFYFSTRLPQILGGGIELFSFMEDQSASILFETAVILLLGKFVFSLLCLSSGVPAGVFLPTLAIGGILGSVTALYSLEYLSESVLAYNSYVVLGIALICTAIFRRPFTAALMAVELTGNFGWLPYILLLAILMNGLLKQFGDRPLNEILLDKLLDEDLNIDY